MIDVVGFIVYSIEMGLNVDKNQIAFTRFTGSYNKDILWARFVFP